MGPMQLPPRRGLALLAMSALLAACGGPDATPSRLSTGAATAAPTVTATPRSGEPTDPPSTVPTPTAAPTAIPIADDPSPLALEAVASGLDSPIGIATGPTGWLLVQEQLGRVIAVDLASGETRVALDIRPQIAIGSERGLLGLTLHPGWPDDQRAFVHYSDSAGDTVLSEFRTTNEPAPLAIDPATERVLMRVDQPFANHNGGQLAFGPDGYLWFALGDGGSGGDPLGIGQNPGTPLGKLLRLDVDAEPEDGRAYAIPDDNPFAAGGGVPEAYLVGLRNPWRFSFDRGTGDLWVADVGQSSYEEVNRIDPMEAAGANLGWNVMEASHCYAVPDCSSTGLVLPVAEYGRDGGCSVTGGYVYRGAAIARLAGWYLFSDYCTGFLFGVRSDIPQPGPGEVAPGPQRLLLETGANVTAFGEDTEGELYLVDQGSGTLYRIVEGS